MLQVGQGSVRRIELITDSTMEQLLLDSLVRREMPDYFLYVGDGGAERWLTLGASEEFPIASRLTDLLDRSIPKLAGHFSGPLDLVSIGVGNGEKERLLLQGLMPSCDIRYIAVDVSSRLVAEGLEAVRDIDVIKLQALARLEDLPSLRDCWKSPVMLCLLGNSFSNFDPESMLPLVRECLAEKDVFLFDCSLLPVGGANGSALQDFSEQVEEVYRSELNRQFNIAPLVDRGMDPDACRFHLDLIQVETPIGRVYRTSKRLEVLADSTVTVAATELELEAGESIQMGFTFKYEPGQVRALLQRHGFEEVELSCSPDGHNMLALVK